MAATVGVAAVALAAAWLGPAPARSQSAGAAGAPADEFRVFEADLGPAWIDVSAYPPEHQQAYALFSRRCSKCHTLARPINSTMQGQEWATYVNRMRRKPGSGIAPNEAETILGFLVFDSARRTRKGSAVDPELLPFMKVSQELTGMRSFPASKRDIRDQNGLLRVTVAGDPRLDLSRFLASEGGQKLLKWTRHAAHKGELALAVTPAAAGKAAPAVAATADPAVKKAAAEATEGETDAKERAELILDWLDEKLEKQYVAGTAEPAAILAARKGDATEFARLFTAMARASGLPARVRVGFVGRRTAFYFHAWAEVWIDGWVAVDPFLGQFPADLTHLRVTTPGDDGLAGWKPTLVPGLDRLELRVVADEAESQQAGG
jgi:hypothetical protein